MSCNRLTEIGKSTKFKSETVYIHLFVDFVSGLFENFFSEEETPQAEVEDACLFQSKLVRLNGKRRGSRRNYSRNLGGVDRDSNGLN